ncbi:hypothetical protein [Sphingopyxis sp. GC21]|uniref:hypothetical protein n=1 Tax=Sphingopyxis sp. GC21 TaxID=2933562 RepID=UPI0021E40387|nr:hypothetical protein [Sphingopyxis sp. GC21]
MVHELAEKYMPDGDTRGLFRGAGRFHRAVFVGDRGEVARVDIERRGVGEHAAEPVTAVDAVSAQIMEAGEIFESVMRGHDFSFPHRKVLRAV